MIKIWNTCLVACKFTMYIASEKNNASKHLLHGLLLPHYHTYKYMTSICFRVISSFSFLSKNDMIIQASNPLPCFSFISFINVNQAFLGGGTRPMNIFLIEGFSFQKWNSSFLFSLSLISETLIEMWKRIYPMTPTMDINS